MAKRLNDNTKRKKAWFKKLSRTGRDLWFYLNDVCDNRGVWIAEFDIASLQLGYAIDEELLSAELGELLIRISDEEYFLPKFVEEQFPPEEELSPTNNAHKGLIKLLSELRTKGLMSPSSGPHQPLTSPSAGALPGALDKEEEENKNKVLVLEPAAALQEKRRAAFRIMGRGEINFHLPRDPHFCAEEAKLKESLLATFEPIFWEAVYPHRWEMLARFGGADQFGAWVDRLVASEGWEKARDHLSYFVGALLKELPRLAVP